MTDEPHVIPLHEPDDFVAAIPAIIGMVPENGMAVAVLLDQDAQIAMTLMAPMNRDAINDAIRHLSTFDRNSHGLILALINEDLHAIQETMTWFGDEFPVPVVSLFFISAYEVGAPYAEILLNHGGFVPDFMTSELTAEAIHRGRQVNRSMADIAKMYAMTEPAVAPSVFFEWEVLPVLTELGEAVSESRSYDPAKVGGLLLHSTQARDATLKVTYVSAPAAHTVFAEASRVLRGPARVEALSAAGLSAYLEGEGVMARHALYAAKSTAAECEPVYEPNLAMTLDEALDKGVPPHVIANSVFKGLISEEDKINDDHNRDD